MVFYCFIYFNPILTNFFFKSKQNRDLKLHSKTPIPSVTYYCDYTQWLDSDGVVTVVNCRQHGDSTKLCSHHAVVNSDYTITVIVQSLCLVCDWWNRSFTVYLYSLLKLSVLGNKKQRIFFLMKKQTPWNQVEFHEVYLQAGIAQVCLLLFTNYYDYPVYSWFSVSKHQ